nr:TOBE domain-containing protein [Mangrovicoccus ximenensis]
MNFFDVVPVEDGEGRLALETAEGTLIPVPAEREPSYRAHLGRSMQLGVRPEDLAVAETGAGIEVKIDVVEPLGQETIAMFFRGGRDCSMRLDPMTPVGPGQTLTLRPNMERAHLIDPESELVVPRILDATEGKTLQ